MARPSKFTPEIHSAIVRALRNGITRKCASEICGIGDRTLRDWCERGRNGEEPFAAFTADVEEAEASVEQAMTATILKSAVKDGDWRAAQLWLERRRAAWRPHSKVDTDVRVDATPAAAAAAVREAFGGHAAMNQDESSEPESTDS